MDAPSFKEFAKEVLEYGVDYLENIRERRVLPNVEPGYLQLLIPNNAPEEAEDWQVVMKDVERVIMPGITHWNSPKFHAYFPSANSYAAIVADLLSSIIGCNGFSWIASPACTELEIIVLDWLGKMVDLPAEFLSCSGGIGGGVIQSTASEGILVTLLGAKAKALQTHKKMNPECTDHDIIPKLVGYCSDQAHSSVERAALLGGVKMRKVVTDGRRKMRGEVLRKVMKNDIKSGLIPFYVVATLGTTSSCAFDPLDEIGAVTNKENVWLHVDAAYAGSAFICPEYRYLMKGIETADSFNFNPHKWLLVNFDCSAMWLKEPNWFIDTYNVDPVYLKHENQKTSIDFRHWQIPLERKFRALKLWFVLRLYGISNLQAYIRKQIALAHHFEYLCKEDLRFEIVEEVIMGLVCFRLKGCNEKNEKLLKKINERGIIHLVPSKIDQIYFLRMAVCSRFSEKEDIELSWNEVAVCADDILSIDM